MKRIIRLLFCIVLVVCLVTGCGQVSSAPTETETQEDAIQEKSEAEGISDEEVAETLEEESESAVGQTTGSEAESTYEAGSVINEESPFFTAITQVCVVVDDLDEYIANYEAYGFTGWEYTDFNSDVITDGEIDGEPSEVSFLCACNKTCDVEIELIQPVSEGTTYDRFLKERGPGVHHILVTRGNSYEDTMAFLEDRNIGIQTKATFVDSIPVVGGMSFMYPDTVKDLGTITEFVDTDFAPDDKYDESGENFVNQSLYNDGDGEGTETSESNEAESKDKDIPFFTAITQVCVVVDDLEKYVTNYEEYGFTGWEYTNFNSDVITDGEIDGEPSEVSFLCACNKTCDVEIELIQPVSEGTTYDRFLKEKGVGIHHILVTRGNSYEETMEFLKSRDIGIQTKATFVDSIPVVGGMSFMYPDTVKDLGMITEFVDTDFSPNDKYDESGENFVNQSLNEGE